MASEDAQNAEVVQRLNIVIYLLQDLFILEASKAGMNKEALRGLLRIDKRRVGRIAKHLKTTTKPRASGMTNGGG